MNDRIRELAVEACKPNAVFKKYINGIDCGMLMRDEELERFAELIVLECARIIQSQDVDPAFKNRMAWAIKERFGVE